MSSEKSKPSLVEVLPLGGYDLPLTYGAKESLFKDLKVGSLVRIPLGIRRITGIVSSISPKHAPPREKLRFITALVQPEPVLSPELVQLAKWVSSYYASSLECTLGAMIPSSVRDGMLAKKRRMIEVVQITDAKVAELLARSPKQMQAYQMLKETVGNKIDAVNWAKKAGISASVLDGLIQKGLAEETISEVNRDAYGDDWSEREEGSVESLRELTPEQQQATNEILADLDTGEFRARLVQGVTGSGKTEVYCQAMEKVLAGEVGYCSWFRKLPWPHRLWTACVRGLVK